MKNSLKKKPKFSASIKKLVFKIIPTKLQITLEIIIIFLFFLIYLENCVECWSFIMIEFNNDCKFAV